jgi:hypothetical protein
MYQVALYLLKVMYRMLIHICARQLNKRRHFILRHRIDIAREHEI